MDTVDDLTLVLVEPEGRKQGESVIDLLVRQLESRRRFADSVYRARFGGWDGRCAGDEIVGGVNRGAAS